MHNTLHMFSLPISHFSFFQYILCVSFLLYVFYCSAFVLRFQFNLFHHHHHSCVDVKYMKYSAHAIFSYICPCFSCVMYIALLCAFTKFFYVFRWNIFAKFKHKSNAWNNNTIYLCYSRFTVFVPTFRKYITCWYSYDLHANWFGCHFLFIAYLTSSI